jgi:hypothetical protein
MVVMLVAFVKDGHGGTGSLQLWSERFHWTVEWTPPESFSPSELVEMLTRASTEVGQLLLAPAGVHGGKWSLKLSVSAQEHRFRLTVQDVTPALGSPGPRVELKVAQRRELSSRLQVALFQALRLPGRLAELEADRAVVVFPDLRDPEHLGPGWLPSKSALVVRRKTADPSGEDVLRAVLHADRWSAGRLLCHVVEPCDRLASLRQDLLVLPARPGLSQLEVAVVGSGGIPLPGASVRWIRRDEKGQVEHAFSTTSSTGSVSTELLGPYLWWVEVRYAGHRVRRAVALSVAEERLVVVLPTRGNRYAWLDHLQELYLELRHRISLREQLLSQLRTAVTEDNVQQAARVLATLEQEQLDLALVLATVGRLQREAAEAGEDVSSLCDQIRAVANQLVQPAQMTSYRQWVQLRQRQAKVQRLKETIARLQAEMKWRDLLKAYQELAELIPEDRALRERVEWLASVIEPRDEEHRVARQVIAQLSGETRVDQLLEHQDLLAAAVEKLIEYRDPLGLLEARQALGRWARLVSQERSYVQEQAARDLSPLEQEELAFRAQLVARLAELLSRLDRQINGTLKELHL